MAEINTYDVYEITFLVLVAFSIYCGITSLIILSIFNDGNGIGNMHKYSNPEINKVKENLCGRVDKLTTSLCDLRGDVDGSIRDLYIKYMNLDLRNESDCCAICIGHNFCLSKHSIRIPIVCDYNESDLKIIPELWDSSSLVYLSKLKQLTQVMVIDLGMFCYSTLVDNPGMKGEQGTTIPDTMEGVIAAYNSTDPKWNALRELINHFKNEDTEIQFQGVSVNF